MRRKYILVFFFAAMGALQPVLSQQFNILDFGAVNDTTQLSTVAINKAVVACSGAGGGKVIIPPGRFKSGTITLLDNVLLYLEQGEIGRAHV